MNSRKDKILVVEDQHGEAVANNLASRGFDVRLATDGREGVELAVSWRPDVVLLDVKLPVMDGFEILAELTRRRVPTRVVMNSGVELGSAAAVRCMRAGACDYFEKGSLTPEQAAERLRRYALVEGTLIERVTDTSPIVEKLLDKSNALEQALSELNGRYALARKQRIRNDIILKAVYVLIAMGATRALTLIVPGNSGILVGLFFLALLGLLFVPTERLRDIRAQVSKFSARIKLD